jgi:hypothetical protein
VDARFLIVAQVALLANVRKVALRDNSRVAVARCILRAASPVEALLVLAQVLVSVLVLVPPGPVSADPALEWVVRQD